MSTWTKLSFALGAVFLTATSAGCVKRELVSFADHESKPLTALHVHEQRSYLLWSSSEYIFYSCSEQGDALACKRLCGGSTDVECPKGTQAGDSFATNIR